MMRSRDAQAKFRFLHRKAPKGRAAADPCSGFTLIEVMMAAVILAVGLLGLAAMQSAAIKANYQAKKHTLAVSLAESQLEAYRGMAYDDIPSGTITESDVTSGDVGHFTRTVTVENDTPVAGLKTITVSVSWNDGKARQATLKTIIGALSPNS